MVYNKHTIYNDEAYILTDVCWCGHHKNSHRDLNRCNKENCNCKRFIP